MVSVFAGSAGFASVLAGSDFAADGTPRFLTANRDFYRVDTALTLPRLRAEDWHLRIHGLVAFQRAKP